MNTTRRALALSTAFALFVGALLVAVLVLPSTPVSASGNGHDDDSGEHHDRVVVVREGESIQAAIDAAKPGTTIKVQGHHVENIWIYKDGIELEAAKGASITMPDEPTVYPPTEGVCGPTLICVTPEAFVSFDALGPDAPLPFDPLKNVEIEGFHLTNPLFDAIGAYFVDRVEIERNTVSDPGCTGVFVLFSTGFEIERNVVTGSMNCAGIEVVASTKGTINRNTTNDNVGNGIAVNDVSGLVIKRNGASGNCIGIGVADQPDDLNLPSTDVLIAWNTTNANNRQCFPFGPDIPIGLTGVLVAGVVNVTVARNTADDNAADLDSITAGGIFVADFPSADFTPPPFSTTTNARVVRNHATGNSSAAGPLDLNLITVGTPLTVRRNACGVAVSAAGPEPGWCQL